MSFPPEQLDPAACAGDPPAGYLHLVDQLVVPVYRYHLIRTGDTARAEARTAKTFVTARERLAAPNRPPHPDEPWLWRLALRTHGDTPTVNAARSPHDMPEGDPSEPDPLRLQQALIPPVAQAFERLSRREAETLALRLFGGLSGDQAAEVLMRSPGAVEKESRQGLRRLVEILSPEREVRDADLPQMERELLGLVERIAPDPRFLASLAERLRQPLPRRSPAQPRPAFPSRENLRRYAWIPAVILGMVLFTLTIWNQPARSGPSATPTPTLPANARSAPPPVPVTASGYLQPASEITCQGMQGAIAEALGVQVSLSMDAPFVDPMGVGEDRNGFGCEIRAVGSGTDFHGIDQTIQTIIPLLVGRGYQVDGQFGSNSACPTCYQFPNDWFGKGLLFDKPDGRAILSVGWSPIDPHLCPTPITQQSCDLPPTAQNYSLRLDLAVDPARQTLLAFFQRWQAGNNAAMDLLSASLHDRLTSLSELNTLAGVDQSQLTKAQVNWRVRRSSSSAIQLLVSIHPGTNFSSASGFAQPIARLAISMTPSSGGWRIENIWRMDYSQNSRDSAYIADPQGRILALSTQDGATVPLTDANFYQPKPGGAAQLSSQVHLSPDGMWLAITRPDAIPGVPDTKIPAGGTWLISTGGSGARLIDTLNLHLIWSPNSQLIAFISPMEPQVIKIYDLATDSSTVLTRMSTPIRGMAWSPDGIHLAVTLALPVKGPGDPAPDGMRLAVIDASTGHNDLQVDFPGLKPDSAADPDREISWTASSDEVWLLPARAAVDLVTHDVGPLIAAPGPAESIFNQLSADGLGQNLTSVSPDGARLANSFNASYQGNTDWVAIHTLGPGQATTARDPVLHPVGALAAMQWTDDSQSLILAGGVDTPQPIWRMNPVNGQTQVLAHSAYFLGLHSNLQRDSLHLAPQAKPVPLTGSRSEAMVQVAMPSYHLSLGAPAWWNVMQPESDGDPGQISSISIPGPAGIASIYADQMVIQISQRSMEAYAADPLADPWPHAAQLGATAWETLHYGSLIAYRLTYPVWPGGPMVIEIPYNGQLTTITKYPFHSSYDQLFEEMLNSLTFDP